MSPFICIEGVMGVTPAGRFFTVMPKVVLPLSANPTVNTSKAACISPSTTALTGSILIIVLSSEKDVISPVLIIDAASTVTVITGGSASTVNPPSVTVAVKM